MKADLLQIEELDQARGGYPVKFFVGHAVRPDNRLPDAVALIPRSLSPEQRVLTGHPARSLTAARAVDLYGQLDGVSEGVLDLGHFLYRLVIRGAVAAKWQDVRLQDPDTRRTYLDLVAKDERLQALPWELLRDPNTNTVPLFLDDKNPVVRGTGRAAVCTEQDWPIRVLVVVGTSDTRAGELGAPQTRSPVRQELDALEDTFSKARYDFEVEYSRQPASAKELGELYKDVRPHVLHFIGHAIAGHSSTDTALVVQRRDGKEWRWDAADLRTLFQNDPPQFAFLNACRTNLLAERVKAGGIAKAFLDAGSRAVLATQGDIPGDVAAEFAGEFYRELAEGQTLDVAVAGARRAVALIKGVNSRDWSLPVLTVRVAPQEVLPHRPAASPIREISEFVDRRGEQRKLRRTIDPIDDPNDPREKPAAHEHMLVVRGAPKVGKSWFVQWCLQRCASRGRRVVYADLRKDTIAKGPKDFLDVLTHIQHGEKNPLREGAASFAEASSAFAEFDRLRAGFGKRTSTVGGPLAPSAVGTSLPVENVSDEMIDQIFTTYEAALKAATLVAREDDSRSVPLIIVLDHITAGVIPGFFKKYIVPKLLLPIAMGNLDPVRVILVVTEGTDDLVELGISEILRHAQEVRLNPFSQDTFIEFMLEYCRQWESHQPWSKIEKAIDALKDLHISGPWEPERFKLVQLVVSGRP